jgi:hypothetical protein
LQLLPVTALNPQLSAASNLRLFVLDEPKSEIYGSFLQPDEAKIDFWYPDRPVSIENPQIFFLDEEIQV